MVNETFDPETIEYSAINKLLSNDLLTEEEEINLAKRLAQGDNEAKKILIERNMRLVSSIVRKYTSPTANDYYDLIQEGAIGLQRGIERFDWRKGFRLSTYATWWIRRAVRRAISKKRRTIRIPQGQLDKINKAQKVCSQLGLDFNPENIAKSTVFSTVEAKKIFQDYRVSLVLSLDDPVTGSSDGSSATILDLISQTPDSEMPDSLIHRNHINQLLTNAMLTLTERQRRVIYLRHLSGNGVVPLEDVGATMNITRERVRQIERLSLKKLKRFLEHYEYDLFT